MKRVWILNHYAQEPTGPGGTRHYSLSKYLPKYGWQALIIAASVELNTGRQRLNPGELSRLDVTHDVPFLWLKTPSYQGNGVGRILNMLAYTAQALLPLHMRKLPRPDIIIGSSVHPFAAWSGAMLARRYGALFIFEVRDLWPQTLVDMGQISENGLPAHLLHRLEKWLYHQARRILVSMPRAADYIVPLGVPAEKIVWLPNGVDLADFPSPLPPVPGETFELMYLGAHGNANGLDHVLDAMAIIQQRALPKPVRMRLIGDGPMKPILIRQAQRLALNNVVFESSVPKTCIPALAAEADAFIITVRNLPRLYRFGISMNKLYDYMAAGRPVLIATDTINNPVQEAKAGFTVSPEDPEALAGAIEALLCMPAAQRNEMALNARWYVETYHDYAGLAKKLARLLDEVCLS